MKSKIKILTADEYRSEKSISASDVKHILPPKTPAHYKAYKDGLIRRVESKAFTIGTLCHTAILEPDLLDDAYVVKPSEIDFRRKEGKAWKDQNEGRLIIDESDDSMLHSIRDNISSHKYASKLVKNGLHEVSVFATHRSGLPVKGRLDILGRENPGEYVADVKTCEAADMQSFSSTIFRYNYHVQAAMYCMLAEVEKFFFICVEKTPPYAIAVYQLDDRALALGRRNLNRALETIASCEEKDEWPSYNELGGITLPLYAYKDEPSNWEESK